MMVSDPHRIEWRSRLVEFLIPRLLGSEGDKETIIEMVSQAINQAHDEGVQDSRYIMERLTAETTGPYRRAYQIATDALRRLSEMNAREE